MGLGLDTLHKLRVVEFDWKDNNAHDIGLIAEEVNKVLPEATYKNEKGEIEGLRILPLVAILIKAIQELDKKVASNG